MKKKYLLFIIFIFSVTSLFASTDLKKPLKQKLSESLYEQTRTEKNTTAGTETQIIADKNFPSFEKNSNLIDMPLSGGIHSFAAIVNQLGKIVVDLCILCCFLCIIFNCFKLWFATTEMKKVFVDIIYKLVVCIILLLIYVPFTNGLISLATKLGSSISGGYKKIDTVYVTAYASLEKAITIGLDDITETMYNHAATDKDGKRYISEDSLAELKAYGMTQEQINEWVAKKGLNIAHPVYETYLGIDDGHSITELLYYKDSNGNIIESKWMGWGFTNSDNFIKEINSTNRVYNRKIDEKAQQALVTKIDSLLEVLDGEGITPEDLDESATEQNNQKKFKGIGTLKNLFYSPYLVNIDGENTTFLSPSKILKTITVMSDATAYGINKTTEEQTGEINDKKLNPGGVWTFKGIVNMLIGLIYKFGMIICCVIVMGEYILTILEFYLVRGLATLLIPFFFLDATKSYAENLIRIFFNYFFKILITVFICYFSMGLFLDTALLTFNSEQTSFNLVLYLSTLSIATMFCTKIPQILSTLTSGNPAMGWGTIAETARGAAHGLHMAQHAVHSAKQVGSGLAHAVQKSGTAIADTKMTLDGARNARMAAMEGAKSWNAKQTSEGSMISEKAAGRQAAFSYLGQSLAQRAKDTAYTAFTGQKAERNNVEDGVILGSIGKTYTDKNGKQSTVTAGMAKEKNKEAASNIGNDVVAKMTKPREDSAMSTKQGTQVFGKPNVRPGIGPD